MKLTRAQLAAQAQFGRQAGNYGKKHLLADTPDLDEITEAWQMEIAAAGFVVRQASQTPLLQPDLEAYFNTADSPKANRLRVRERCRTAPDEVVRVMRLTDQNGLIQWWRPRAALLARRPDFAIS